MKKLLLFDVDGTLTKSRLTIEEPMKEILKKLHLRDDLDLGIVGGSNYDKQIEQLGEDVIKFFKYIFSENGLVYRKNGVIVEETSINKFLGEINTQKIINFSLRYLSNIILPVKRGTFIEFRTGMINVCPIGRSCSQDERIEFFEYDNKNGVRKNLREALINEFSDLGLNASLGGQISIDVFPNGWDKTYCLRFVEGKYDEIHFFGDKTDIGGNDYEIFIDPRTIGHSVMSPNDTVELLNKF